MENKGKNIRTGLGIQDEKKINRVKSKKSNGKKGHQSSRVSNDRTNTRNNSAVNPVRKSRNNSAVNPVRKLRKKKKIRRMIKRLMRLFLVIGTFVMLVVCIILAAGHNWKGHLDRSTKVEAGNKSKEPPDNEEEEKMIMPERIKEFSEMYHVSDDRYTKFTVCIDAGHGGDDSGAESLDGRYEKNQNLLLAKMVKEYVESVGINVVMTRQRDKTVSLNERRNIAERSGADLLISLHRNVYEGDEDINGIEIWINSSENERDIRVAESVLKSVEDNVSGVNNRGVKSGSMDNSNENYILNESSMTSMIIEVGFISSEYDNKLFDKYTEDFAMAIAKGIVDSVEDIQ